MADQDDPPGSAVGEDLADCPPQLLGKEEGRDIGEGVEEDAGLPDDGLRGELRWVGATGVVGLVVKIDLPETGTVGCRSEPVQMVEPGAGAAHQPMDEEKGIGVGGRCHCRLGRSLHPDRVKTIVLPWTILVEPVVGA